MKFKKILLYIILFPIALFVILILVLNKFGKFLVKNTNKIFLIVDELLLEIDRMFKR